ncbi:MAG: regulatory protein RecX [Oscillospiraceae bacterium]|nr:regulatory protein RecX [Oscillospiraceae bacterium]
MANELETAKKRAMYLLGGRDYSRKELFDKLLKNYSRETCEEAVRQMAEYGYLDDRRYADKLARKYVEVRKYGKSRAKMMMIQKGLGPSIAADALSRYSADDMVEEITAIIEKKYMDKLSVDGAEGMKEMQKVMAALARRGYSYDHIKKAVSLAKENAEFEEDW